jgi:hypothetical protein
VASAVQTEEVTRCRHRTFLLSPKCGHFYCRLTPPSFLLAPSRRPPYNSFSQFTQAIARRFVNVAETSSARPRRVRARLPSHSNCRSGRLIASRSGQSSNRGEAVERAAGQRARLDAVGGDGAGPADHPLRAGEYLSPLMPYRIAPLTPRHIGIMGMARRVVCGAEGALQS